MPRVGLGPLGVDAMTLITVVVMMVRFGEWGPEGHTTFDTSGMEARPPRRDDGSTREG